MAGRFQFPAKDLRRANPEQRCVAERPRSTNRHEAAMGAVPMQERTNKMLEYLRLVLAESAIAIVNVTTLDETYEAAVLVAVDRLGMFLAVKQEHVAIGLPWARILKIEIEE